MMRILLIDDEPGVTENLKDYLEDESHRVEVLNYVADQDHLDRTLDELWPEGIILDYDMAPNGVIIYGWLRQWLENGSGSPTIVFYTKYANSQWHRAKMLEAGSKGGQIIPKVEVADDVAQLLRALRAS